MKQKNFISNLKNIFFIFLLKIRGFFVQKPTRKLTWSVEDYEFAKKLKTLWDYCEDRYDSVYTIQNVNNFIKI
jgi:hypothetical protein